MEEKGDKLPLMKVYNSTLFQNMHTDSQVKYANHSEPAGRL